MPLSPVMVELRASISEFQAKMGEARAEVAKLEAESKSHLAKFQAFGKAATLGVAAGVAVIGVESIKMAGEFQASTSVLQTAAGETTAGLKIVRKGILDIAKETGTTWQNLSEGMYQVEKAGYRGAGGLKVLRAAAQGAKEENASLEVVANAMTSVMASYNIPVDKSVQVMNALKTAAAGTKDTMQNFAASLSTVLPIASAAHLSFAQIGGALAALTRHGTSSKEATQELAFSIRNLIAPNNVAVKTMQQFGISSVDVTQKLGQRGLTGTLNYMIQTLAEHTKGGLVQIGMMRRSASAMDDLKKMTEAMSPPARKMAEDLMNNTITVKDFRKEITNLDPQQTAMARQFATLSIQAKGFSDAAKAGLPVQATMESQLKKMTGGAVGLNTALMLSGGSTAYANEMTKRIADSMNNASKEVEGWHQTQNLLNTRLDRFKQTVEAAAIDLGTKLIPAVSAVIDWMGQHKTAVEVLAAALGTVLVAAIAAYIAKLVYAAATSVVNFTRMVVAGGEFAASQEAGFAKSSAAAIRWVGVQAVQAAKTVASYVAQGAAAAASAAVQVGSWVAVAAAATAAFVAENIASLGIIAAIAAIVAAAIYLYKHWDEVWGFIKRIAGEAVSFIKGHLLAFSIALGPIGVAAYALYRNWNTVWGGIKSVISSAYDFIKPIIDAISSAISTVSSAISGLASAASAVKSTLGGGVGAFLSNPLSFGGGKATGGPVLPGTTYMVGERGPELLTMGANGGSITPNGAGGNMDETNGLLRDLLSTLKSQPREMQRLARTA